jgi:hypothetical protein
MNERPKSITIICWILIAMAGILFAANIFAFNNPAAQEIMSKNPIPISIQYVMLFFGLFITIVCGIAMLKGMNWARLLYIGLGIIGVIIDLVASPTKGMAILEIIIFSIFVFFLLRPKANEYFKSTEIA